MVGVGSTTILKAVSDLKEMMTVSLMGRERRGHSKIVWDAPPEKEALYRAMRRYHPCPESPFSANGRQ